MSLAIPLSSVSKKMGCAAGSAKAREATKQPAIAPSPSPSAAKGQMAQLCKKATLLQVAAGGIPKDYEVKETLSYSPYMQVRKVLHKPSGETRVVKIIDKSCLLPSALTSARTLREVEVLKRLDSPSVLRLFEVFEDKFRFYLIEEAFQGQDLLQFVSENSNSVQTHLKSILKQLFASLSYIHTQGIVLTSLTFEGIALLSVPEGVLVKLTDFHSAVFTEEIGTIAVPKGNSLCQAPEVATGRWSSAADLWSCGIVLYTLLFGSPPHFHSPGSQVNWSYVGELNEGLRAMLQGLLETAVAGRWTAARALTCPWLSDSACFPLISETRMQETMQEMKTFRSSYKLKDAIFTFLSFHVLSNTDAQSLQEVFLSLDTNGDSKVSREELLRYFQTHCVGANPMHEVTDLLSQVDIDGSGFIDYSEFLRASLNRRKYASQEYLEMAFRHFDVDGGGKISAKDLETILGSCSKDTEAFVNAIIAEADFNKDGEIDFTEFMTVALRKF